MDTLRDKNLLEELWASRQGAVEDVVTAAPQTPRSGAASASSLTGHTGFKGAWLALWLHRLGAEVTGHQRCRRRRAPTCTEAGMRRRAVPKPASATSAMRGAVAALGPRGAAGDRVPPRGAAAGARQLSRSARHVRDQRDGHRAPARRAARASTACARPSW